MMRDRESELEPGSVVEGRWVVRRVLGQGATTVVYAAEDLDRRRAVALKVLRGSCAEGGMAHARFLREASIVGGLVHPSIVALEGSGRLASGQPYLVLERLAGETLAQRLRREGPLALPVMQRFMADALGALGVAHAMTVVHRDLKPDNLFVSPRHDRERLVLLDFGVGRVMDDQGPRLTATPQLVGTIGYLAPEQAQSGAHDADHRADLYAAGVVAFQMITGKLPYAAGGLRVLRAIREDEALRPSALRADLGARVDAFFARALSKPRSERFQSAREMAEALGRL